MKYLKAILSTILLVLVPLIITPLLQWYKREIVEPNTDLFGIYMLFGIITFGMLIITVINWASAISDSEIKDIL